MDDPSRLADLVADAITDRTGRIWDEAARARLAAWLDTQENRDAASAWLAYLEMGAADPLDEFTLRKPLSDILSGGPDDDPVGFIAGSRPHRWFRRRRPHRPGRQR